MKSTLMKVVAVAVPSLSLLMALPILTEVLPREVRSGEYHWQFWLIGLAALLGILSSAGYLEAVLKVGLQSRGSKREAWVRLSLVGAVLASLCGLVFSVIAFWPLALLPLLTAAMTLYMLRLHLGRRA